MFLFSTAKYTSHREVRSKYFYQRDVPFLDEWSVTFGSFVDLDLRGSVEFHINLPKHQYIEVSLWNDEKLNVGINIEHGKYVKPDFDFQDPHRKSINYNSIKEANLIKIEDFIDEMIKIYPLIKRIKEAMLGYANRFKTKEHCDYVVNKLIESPSLGYLGYSSNTFQVANHLFERLCAGENLVSLEQIYQLYLSVPKSNKEYLSARQKALEILDMQDIDPQDKNKILVFKLKLAHEAKDVQRAAHIADELLGNNEFSKTSCGDDPFELILLLADKDKLLKSQQNDVSPAQIGFFKEKKLPVTLPDSQQLNYEVRQFN